MKDRIVLQHISKSYGEQIIFKDFSYTFKEKGGYLLFGPSGCGKTTLLNILAGIESFEKGSYYFDGEDFSKSLSYQSLSYITQDVYLIDYLTIRENLEISCENKESFLFWAENLGVEDILDKYPYMLSGGEKQRVAMIRGLCLPNPILLLDEPTANLDEENKVKIFEILKKLSNDNLVICVSHDEVSKAYFDNFIDFHNISEYEKTDLDTPNYVDNNKRVDYILNFNINNYIEKQKRIEEKYSKIILMMIFILAFLMIDFTLNPTEKITNSLFNLYDLNYLNVEIPVNDTEFLNKVKSEYDLGAIVYDYRYGADYRKIPDRNQVVGVAEEYSESLTYEIFPIEKVNEMANHVQYGSYFTKSNQVMLGYQKALEYTENPNTLIGQEIMIHTPLGEEMFEIAGIFEPIKEDLSTYLAYDCQQEVINKQVFFNNAYTEKYRNDERLSQNEISFQKKSHYTIYFNSQKDLKRFYDTYHVDEEKKGNVYVEAIEASYLNTLYVFEGSKAILIPISIISFILSIFFYIFGKSFQLQKTKKNFSVYNYYGYSWKKVFHGYFRYFMKQTMIYSSFSAILSLVIAHLLNLINQKFMILAFPLFTIDIRMTIIISIVLFVIMMVLVYLMMIRFKKIKWFDNLKAGRDLL